MTEKQTRRRMKTIKVGLGTCGVSAGSEKTYEAIKLEIEGQDDIQVLLKETGCNGMCYREPLVEVIDEENQSILYGDVTPEKAKRIVSEHIVGNAPVEEWIIKSSVPAEDDTFLVKQKRIVLRNCGVIDPNSIDEYIAPRRL